MKTTLFTNGHSLSLPLFDAKKSKAVKLAEIAWLEADSNYTTFHFTNGEKLMVSRTMKEYMEILDDNFFVRTHKSFAVNIRHIIKYDVKDEMMVLLQNGRRITISRRKKKEFVEKMAIAYGWF